MKFYPLLLLVFFFNAYSITKVKLPEMATKQEVNNLRFISNDGAVTYYQRTNGFLNFSTNYEVSTLLKGKKNSQYLVSVSPHKKKIIVTRDEDFYLTHSLRKDIDIYVGPYNSKGLEFIDKGISPKLHLDDSLLSYYLPQIKTLKFKNLELQGFDFKISISENSPPYFTPDVVVLNKDEIIYTDQNQKGETGVILLNKGTKKTQVLLKTEGPFENIELCLHPEKKSLLIGRFSTFGSEIYQSAASDLSKLGSIYSSREMDFGHLDCSEKDQLYFIKSVEGDTDLFSYKLSSKTLKQLTHINRVTNYINMDGKLIIPFRGKYYLVKGENNIPFVDLLDKKNSKKDIGVYTKEKK